MTTPFFEYGMEPAEFYKQSIEDGQEVVASFTLLPIMYASATILTTLTLPFKLAAFPFFKHQTKKEFNYGDDFKVYENNFALEILGESFQAAAQILALPVGFLSTVSAYTIGTVFGATIMPFIKLGGQTFDYVKRAKEEWKRPRKSAAEKEFRAEFGRISIKGYEHWGGAVELKAVDSRVVNFRSDKNTGELKFSGYEPDYHRMETNCDREEGVKNLLGGMASTAAGYSRRKDDNEERFIMVANKDSNIPEFYEASKIDNAYNTQAGDRVVSHKYYNSGAGTGGVSSERQYAVRRVSAEKAKKLRSLVA